MAAPAARLARVLTAAYACRVNAQLVHPARAQVVKPHELASALARPLHAAAYAPESPAAYLAATLAFGIINGHPFLDGNKRTAFFLANEYLRAQGLPGLLEGIADERGLVEVAERYIAVAAGTSGVEGLLGPSDP